MAPKEFHLGHREERMKGRGAEGDPRLRGVCVHLRMERDQCFSPYYGQGHLLIAQRCKEACSVPGTSSTLMTTLLSEKHYQSCFVANCYLRQFHHLPLVTQPVSCTHVCPVSLKMCPVNMC